MTIRVLIAGEDANYMARIADVMNRATPSTGDTLEISLYTDKNKLINSKDDGKAKYHVAFTDEAFVDVISDWVPVLMLLTEDDNLDNTTDENLPIATYVYKYQRVSGLVNKMLLTQAKKRENEGKGSGTVCAFFSPSGGNGTSTVAVAFAMAAATQGIKPLFVSLELFNSSEYFFSDETNTGLYDVFCAIAGGSGVTAVIDAAKSMDASGVAFLKKFEVWSEVSRITPDEMQSFIKAAQAANDTDIVVLDIGGGLGSFTQSVLDAADEIFIVSETHPIAASKLKSMLDEKDMFASRYIDNTSLIFNRVQGNQSEGYGCKNTTSVPNIGGANPKDVAASAAQYVRGLVNKAWIQKNATI